MTECTPKEERAKMNNKPKLKSVKAIPFPKGITIHADIAKVNVNIGAKLKIQKSA